MRFQPRVMRACLSLVLSLLMAGMAAPTFAAAPFQNQQAPGYYRFHLGHFEITALNDGTFPMPVGKLLKDVSESELNAALQRSFLSDPIDASVNGFLINTGSKLVLIDTGTGGSMGPSVGRLVQNLVASGYQPAQVDEIYITHMHGDHIGGLSRDGHAVFPNAILRIARSEADYWLDAAKRDSAPAEVRGSFDNAATALAPYIDAHHFVKFNDDADLVDGIHARAAHGHTPGHTVYVVTSDHQSLLVWGDLMHVASVQFPNPAVTIGFDSDRASALKQRQDIFAEIAHKGMWAAGAHLPFPGIGHLRPSGNGYDFQPINYQAAF